MRASVFGMELVFPPPPSSAAAIVTALRILAGVLSIVHSLRYRMSQCL